MNFPTFDLSLPAPKDLSRGIGIVGAGAIVNAAHLPAYRKAGFSVVGLADANAETARATAARHGVATVYDSVDALIADPRVEIVDIAVNPQAQHDIALKAISAGKHLLCQKPLAEEMDAAESLVAAADAAGTVIAVNQQMRWDPLIAAYRELLAQRFFGQVTSCLFDLDIVTDFASWRWMADRPRLEYFYHSIHHLDSVRSLFGMPSGVTAVAARYPGAAARGESRTTTVLDYPDEFRVVLQIDHNNWSTDTRALVRIRGTDGYADGTLGLLNDYPNARPDTIALTHRSAPGRRVVEQLPGSWAPDAFIGTMGELMCAIEEGRAPATSAADNLQTLRLVHAAYESIETQRRVAVGDDSRRTNA
jgi:predicted dehydrogenase